MIMDNVQENKVVETTEKAVEDVAVERAAEKKADNDSGECLCNCDHCEKLKQLADELDSSREKVKELEIKLSERETLSKKKKKLGVDYVWTDKKRTFLGLPLSFTRYILTETKFIIRTGFFTIMEDEVDLYRILDKSFMQTLGQRIFGCGTVTITSSEKDSPKKEIKSIKKPREFMDILEKYVDAQRTKYSVRGRDMIGMGVPITDCDCDCEEHN